MIYAQRPDATACADFDIWNNRMNRTDWLKMMKSRVEITTYTSYERAIVHKIVPYFEPLHYTLQDMEQHHTSLFGGASNGGRTLCSQV